MKGQGLEVWFLTGSQPLYGADILAQVADQSKQVVATLNAASELPIKATWKPVLTTPEDIKEDIEALEFAYNIKVKPEDYHKYQSDSYSKKW